jgi:hypothetical protein
MKLLLTITALAEGAAGLAFAIVPSLLVSILLGTSLKDSSAVLVGRLAGAALMSIAVACWLSRTHTHSSNMVKAMLGYNIFSSALLIYAGLIEKISGPGLWPAILLHVGLTAWCIASLRKTIQRTVHSA